MRLAMLTVSFQLVLEGVFKLAGIVPADAAAADKVAVIEHIADRYKSAHEYYRWPKFTKIEERYFAPIWDGTEIYSAGDIVYYPTLDAYYIALDSTAGIVTVDGFDLGPGLRTRYHSADYGQNGAISLPELLRVIALYNYNPGSGRTGEYHTQAGTIDGFATGPGVLSEYHSADYNQDGMIDATELARVTALYNYTSGGTRTGEYHDGPGPDDEPDYWEEISAFNHQVDYEQDGETAIGAVFAAWDKDPRVYADAQQLRYKLRRDGISFAPGIEVTSVWLEFRPRARDFAAEIYDAAAAYAVGDLIYYTDGEVWKCLVATTAAQTPESHAAKWELVEFPEFLARAVKAGALADWLSGDEKPDNADKWEGQFTDRLEAQVWQITKLQGQTGRPSVAVFE